VSEPAATTEPVRRILLVEDDPALALGLVDALEFEGFAVTHARTGHDALARTAAHKRGDARVDCIILDIMLPDTNGYRLCEQIRRDDEVVPILMLTARSQEADKIRGLESGADDYVTKPFSIGELVARIRAMFRRASRGVSHDVPFTIGRASIDPVAQVLTRGREHVKLSFYEVALLKYLHERAGTVVSREEILDRVWGTTAGSNGSRTVDNFVVKLRKKLEPDQKEPVHILTVYGMGYKLVV
jgi:DNA-binding response OmpR family regulator